MVIEPSMLPWPLPQLSAMHLKENVPVWLAPGVKFTRAGGPPSVSLFDEMLRREMPLKPCGLPDPAGSPSKI